MRKDFIARLAVSLMIPLAAAPAKADNFYVTANGGLGSTRFNQSDGDNDTSNISGTYGGGIGYRWDTEGTFRYRAELEYSHVSANELLFSNAGIDLRENLVLANAIAEFNTKAWVKPYVGFGIGWGRIRAQAARNGNGQPLVDLEDSSTNAFAYQVIGGLTIAPGERFEFFADARYMKPTGVTYVLFDNRDLTVNEVNGFGSIQGRFGVRLNF